jgi:hypothetical protein
MKSILTILFLAASSSHAAEFNCADFSHPATILHVDYSTSSIDGTRTIEGRYTVSTQDNGDVSGSILGLEDGSGLLNFYQADQEGQPEPPISRGTLQLKADGEAELQFGNLMTTVFCKGDLPGALTL